MEIISITNQKGGVSKTTTAQSLAIGLALRKYKVLLIDADPQSNLSYTFKVLNQGLNLYDLLKGTCTIQQAITKTEYVDIIAGSLELVSADKTFTGAFDLYLLKNQLDLIKNNYDYVIIDTSLTLGILTLNAFVSSDSVIIPMTPDVYSIQGTLNIKNQIDLITANTTNKKLYIKGLLLTKYNDRTLLNRELKETIDRATTILNTKLFNTAIRESVAVRESQAKNSSVLIDYPSNNASIDYQALINEIIK